MRGRDQLSNCRRYSPLKLCVFCYPTAHPPAAMDSAAVWTKARRLASLLNDQPNLSKRKKKDARRGLLPTAAVTEMVDVRLRRIVAVRPQAASSACWRCP